MRQCIDARTIGFQIPTPDTENPVQLEPDQDDSSNSLINVSTNDVAVETLPVERKENRGFKMLRSISKWKKKQSLAAPPSSTVRIIKFYLGYANVGSLYGYQEHRSQPLK